MTHDEMIETIVAHSRGKQIQRQRRGSGDVWLDTDPSWNFLEYNYRVKPDPEPLLVPHWPVITLAGGCYFVTSEQYASEEAGRKSWRESFIRLATEYPPVMLPKVKK